MVLLRCQLYIQCDEILLACDDYFHAKELDPHCRESILIFEVLKEKSRSLYFDSSSYFLANDCNSALNCIHLSISIVEEPKRLLMKAKILRKLKYINESISDLQSALRFFEKHNLYVDPNTYNDHWDSKINSKTIPETHSEILKLLSLLYSDAAIIEHNLNNKVESVQLMDISLTYDKSLELFVRRGDYLHSVDRLKDALNDYHEASNFDRNNQVVNGRISLLHDHFGLIAFNTQKFNEAENHFTMAIEHQNNPVYYIHRASTYYQLQRYKDSINDYNKALDLNPNNQEAKDLLHLVQTNSGINPKVIPPAKIFKPKSNLPLIPKLAFGDSRIKVNREEYIKDIEELKQASHYVKLSARKVDSLYSSRPLIRKADI